MKRHWVYAFAAVVMFPCLAQAQGDPGWGPVFRITPWIGVSPGIKQRGEAVAFNENNTISVHRYDLEYSSSLPLGLNLEYRFYKSFSVVAGGAWSQRGSGTIVDFEDEFVWELEGTNYLMAKAGLAMRLRELNPDLQLRRLNAAIFIAPAFIRDAPRTTLATPAQAGFAINHWGVNMGAEAEMPLANERLAFNVGLEDWMIFWDNEGYVDRIEPYMRAGNASIDEVGEVEGDRTHLWVLRFGLTYRF